MQELENTWGHSLEWTNPYTSPPEGMPKTIKKIFDGKNSLSDETREEILAAWPDGAPFEYHLGCGYGWGLMLPNKKRKQWSEKTKIQARKKRKITAIKKAYPLFQDEFVNRLESELTRTAGDQ